jgi:hypothetical protein
MFKRVPRLAGLSICLVWLVWSNAVHADGVIQGTITDARTGAPAAGVVLRLGFPSVIGIWTPIDSIPTEVTASDGSYRFASVPNRTYKMRIEPEPPLLTKFWPNEPCISQSSCNGTSASGLLSISDGVTRIADASVGTPGTLSGKVLRDDNQQPIVGALITARWDDGTGFYVDNSLTDANGDYVIAGLPPGPYRVAVDGPDEFVDEVFDNVPCIPSCSHDLGDRTQVMVASDGDRSGVDFGLGAGGVIAGLITEPGGLPPAIGLIVRLRRLTSNGYSDIDSTEVSTGGGSFALSGLPAGTYKLGTHVNGDQSRGAGTHAHEVFDDLDCASDNCTTDEIDAGTPIVLSAGQVIDSIRIEIDPAASLAGCVDDAITGEPLPDVVVVAYRSPFQPGPLPSPRTIRHARTGSDGCYEITHLHGLPGDPYRLRTLNRAGYVDELFLDSACYGGLCDFNHGHTIEVLHDQDIAGLDFSLNHGASISGVVREFAGGPVIENYRLIIQTISGRIRSDDEPYMIFDGDGSFQTYALADDTYYLTVEVLQGPYRGFYTVGVPSRVGSTPPHFTEGTPFVISGGNSIAALDIALTAPQFFGNGFE